MGKLIKRIVLEDFRWHDLRHCSASYMRQDGLSLGHIGNLATNLRRLQSVIRTLVRKILLRLGRPFLRDCTDKLILNAYENAYERVFPKLEIPQTIGITSNGQIAQLVEQRTENPWPYSNISDLAPKTMQTNTDKALECRQNADK